jgi:hypothetical protein
MYQARMDLALLCQTTGFWAWRVRRHLRPEVFRRLAPRILQRYADAMGIPLETLGRVAP